MNYYSQFGEDKIIEEYFGKDYVGGCIDVGASNGVSISNTLGFEENGWYCLCIEPNPMYFNDLKQNRSNAVEYAISNRNDEMIFKIVNLGNNIEDAVSALTLDKKLLDQFDAGGWPIKITPILVKTITLDNCIEQFYKYDTIDFISIDTEGTELDVLKGFSIQKWNPKLLVIENNWGDPDIEIYLELFGYKKHKRLEINDFYIKK